MNVPAKMLEKLKCVNCDLYLSCGPVYIKHKDGEAYCGRCGKPEEEPVTENKQYETVAELLRFPCKYSEFGCQEKLKFSKNQNPHEEICNFRKRLCPIAERGTCEWLGTWNELLQHCKDKHSELVLENPCSIRHDISKSRLINYLLVAFNLLFVLHTKVCCTSGKIFHAIRFLGQSEKAKDFEYQLDIKRNKENLTKYGKVAPEGCLSIQENTSLGLSINSLLEIFSGFDGTEFKITLNKVKEKLEEPEEQIITKEEVQSKPHSHHQDNKSKCVYCEDSLLNPNFGLCNKCKINVTFCKNKEKGCKYYDIHEKCFKHETYYCNFNTKCTRDKYTAFCNSTIEQGTLFKHLISKHKVIIKPIDRVSLCTKDENKRLLLTSDIGVIIVEYCDNGLTFFNIYSPLTSKELKYYSCTVEITEGEVPKCVVPCKSDETKEDWSFRNIILNDFDIRVSIKKNE